MGRCWPRRRRSHVHTHCAKMDIAQINPWTSREIYARIKLFVNEMRIVNQTLCFIVIYLRRRYRTVRVVVGGGAFGGRVWYSLFRGLHHFKFSSGWHPPQLLTCTHSISYPTHNFLWGEIHHFWTRFFNVAEPVAPELIFSIKGQCPRSLNKICSCFLVAIALQNV